MNALHVYSGIWNHCCQTPPQIPVTSHVNTVVNSHPKKKIYIFIYEQAIMRKRMKEAEGGAVGSNDEMEASESENENENGTSRR